MAREKPTQKAEIHLIELMLDGTYPPGSALPGERDLCRQFGVARPALREALQRLAREGWLDIQQGKSTTVRDFMRHGNLNILQRVLKASDRFAVSFVPDLLEMWAVLAPVYTRRTFERDASAIGRLLAGYAGLEDSGEAYALAQWRLHRALLDGCGNPIYGMMLNSFGNFYRRISPRYFAEPAARAEARDLWQTLYGAALNGEAGAAAEAIQSFIQGNIDHWWVRISAHPAQSFSDDQQELDSQELPSSGE
jgi:GntR family negative regulator for fad regulon and positive regulator of fabA